MFSFLALDMSKLSSLISVRDQGSHLGVKRRRTQQAGGLDDLAEGGTAPEEKADAGKEAEEGKLPTAAPAGGLDDIDDDDGQVGAHPTGKPTVAERQDSDSSDGSSSDDDEELKKAEMELLYEERLKKKQRLEQGKPSASDGAGRGAARYDSDVLFRPSAKPQPKNTNPSAKLTNDTLHSDGHQKFMKKYFR